jgi:poly-gamma-glutamate capsule biosynthesis protein CapA/YwtB (metallophosphatase superfamily)
MDELVTPSRRRFLTLAAGGFTASLAGQRAQGAQPRQLATRELRSAGTGSATLAFGGDWFLTRRVSSSADEEAQRVFSVLREADAAFVNLENGLSTIGSPELGAFRYGAALRGDPQLASELSWAGVAAVSLANNHTGNYGRAALLQTISTLDEAGIEHAGAGGNLTEAVNATPVKAGGLSVGFLSVYSYYYVFGADDLASENDAGIAYCRAYDVVVQQASSINSSRRDQAPYLVSLEHAPTSTTMAALREDVDRIKTAIKEAAAINDLVVVSVHFHWARHTKHDVPAQQRAFAQELIDAGADLIVGHGPHAIHGIELHRGRPIVYSVGNIVLMPPSEVGRKAGAAPGRRAVAPAREGLVLRVIASKHSVRAIELLPIAIGDDGIPRFARDRDAVNTVAKLNGLSASLGTEIQLADWFGYLEIT